MYFFLIKIIVYLYESECNVDERDNVKNIA